MDLHRHIWVKALPGPQARTRSSERNNAMAVHMKAIENVVDDRAAPLLLYSLLENQVLF
jgi:hypothetical protein